jgi:hypothetical protein
MPVFLGAGNEVASLGYEAHVLQLPELQLEHELPPVPAMRFATPDELILKQAKVDILRRDGLPHFGQSASWSAWLKGRSFSNLKLHSGQTYSYNGITSLLFIV